MRQQQGRITVITGIADARWVTSTGDSMVVQLFGLEVKVIKLFLDNTEVIHDLSARTIERLDIGQYVAYMRAVSRLSGIQERQF